MTATLTVTYDLRIDYPSSNKNWKSLPIELGQIPRVPNGVCPAKTEIQNSQATAAGWSERLGRHRW